MVYLNYRNEYDASIRLIATTGWI